VITLRHLGWPVELVGFGNRDNGICTVRLVGGPDHGKVFEDVHFSDLVGSYGGEVALAFYGRALLHKTRRAPKRHVRARNKHWGWTGVAA